VKLGEGSGDLQEVFGEDEVSVPMANDTSFGVGRAADRPKRRKSSSRPSDD